METNDIIPTTKQTEEVFQNLRTWSITTLHFRDPDLSDQLIPPPLRPTYLRMICGLLPKGQAPSDTQAAWMHLRLKTWGIDSLDDQPLDLESAQNFLLKIVQTPAKSLFLKEAFEFILNGDTITSYTREAMKTLRNILSMDPEKIVTPSNEIERRRNFLRSINAAERTPAIETETGKPYYILHSRDKHLKFENEELTLQDDWSIQYHESVTFSNCKFQSEKGMFRFLEIPEVTFENCTFENFQNGIALSLDVDRFFVKGCTFINSHEYIQIHHALTGLLRQFTQDADSGKEYKRKRALFNFNTRPSETCHIINCKTDTDAEVVDFADEHRTNEEE